MKKQWISAEQACLEFGIVAAHERMPNGELRFRLFGGDGNGYVRTVASETGGWQLSHSHSTFRELYLVESGWMALATPGDAQDTPRIAIYHLGETCTTSLGQIHNVYLPGNAIIHTIKFGVRGAPPRWQPEASFDPQTHRLSESDVLASGSAVIR